MKYLFERERPHRGSATLRSSRIANTALRSRRIIRMYVPAKTHLVDITRHDIVTNEPHKFALSVTRSRSIAKSFRHSAERNRLRARARSVSGANIAFCSGRLVYGIAAISRIAAGIFRNSRARSRSTSLVNRISIGTREMYAVNKVEDVRVRPSPPRRLKTLEAFSLFLPNWANALRQNR